MAKAKLSLRQPTANLMEGVKEMYTTVYETEHKLLHVQAGSTFKSHLNACMVSIAWASLPLECMKS